MNQKSRLALKMLLVVALLGISIFAAGFQIRADTDVGSFSAWRPWTSDCGCHSGAANTWGEGTVEFDLPMVVLPGQHFTIRLRVAGFVDAADGAIALGLHTDDMDNGEFLTETVAEGLHGVDISGDSVDWAAAFDLVAPETPGTYALRAYGVDGLGGTAAWKWVTAYATIAVIPGAHSSLQTYVEASADYLMTVAEPDSGGLKWAEYNGTSAKYKTSYLKGAAGIGELFLDLYHSTNADPFFEGVTPKADIYLNTAKGAATWLETRAIAEYGGYKWPRDLNADNSIAGASNNYTGMYDGAAGIGTFFLDMYRTTGDSSYLTYAEGAATWLVSMANKSHGFAFVESETADNSTELSTRWTYGSPGIGGFFIDLYLTTGNSNYATYANKTAEGLIYYADSSEGGYSWTRYNGNTERFVGRWHGAAGIATFFLEMYDLFGNATHLQYAEGTAEWIYGTHEIDNGDLYPDNNAAVSKSYKLGGWSRSPAGIGSFFLRLYQTTNNQIYMNRVTEITDFLTNNATLSNGGFAWDDSNDNDRIATALGHGLAGTGMFFVEAYQATGNPEYAAVIQGITQALGDRAVETDDGIAWTQSDKTSDVHYGLYYGVAGVGMFMNLAAHSGMTFATQIDDALEYLQSAAVADAGGLKWPEYNGTSAKYKTSYLKGAAGIGSLFLNAYKAKHGDRFFAGVSPQANDYLNT
ncbi:MAG: lanthionine synthetase LanC family protein, partial [Candidatus Thorarchaeota archaeon]